MKRTKLIKQSTLTAAIATLLFISSQPAPALSLVDDPLFLSTGAKANLFFLFDNTDSMHAEATRDGTYVFSYGIESSNTATGTPGFIDICTDTGCSANNATTNQNYRSYSFNKLYYNPTATYKAWPNSPVTCTFAQAAVDASFSTTKYVNLGTSWGTHLGSSSIPGSNSAGYYSSTPASTANWVPLPAAQQQNFANWFCYYRTRMLAAKSAIVNTIHDIPAGVGLRVGINTFKNENFINLTDITASDLTDTNDGGVIARKGMTDKINAWEFCGDSAAGCAGGTNTFAALTRAGHYFKCDDASYPMGSTTSGTTRNTGRTTGACAYTNSIIPTAVQACTPNYVAIVTDGQFGDSATTTGDDTVGQFNPTTPAKNAASTASVSFVSEVHKGTASNTLADLAMDLYNADFFSTIDNSVPTVCGVDENPGQHLVTYGVSIGVPTDINIVPQQPKMGIMANCTASSDADKLSYINTIVHNYSAGTTYTTLSSVASVDFWKDNIGTNDKMNQFVHATYNGRGKFFLADGGDTLSESLTNIANDAASRHLAAASVGLSSTANTSGTTAYLSTYYSGYWYGEFTAYPLTNSGLGTPAWNAHTILDALTDANVAGTGRKIVTYNRENKKGVPFLYVDTGTNALSDEQLADLNTNSAGGTDTNGALRLNFIRGDHTCESDYTVGTCSITRSFRNRVKTSSGAYTRLGDLINSAPVYVGAPIGNYLDSLVAAAPYSTFKTNNLLRKPMVYVGGNDGMLHAFSACTTEAGCTDGGKEIFAYVPNLLSPRASTMSFTSNTADQPGLHALTIPGHHSYVDLTPTIADAYGTFLTESTSSWHTVLVGGLRHGGKGVYALNVTNPASITDETTAASNVMWEFTANDDEDMGYSYSQPLIIPLKTSSTTIAWFAVFGNGYNSKNGKAVLYLVKLAGPKDTGAGTSKWFDSSKTNPDFYKIVLDGTGPDNGLSSPAAVDISGSDGIYDHVYVGDLKGNMWAIDLSSSSPSAWNSAYLDGSNNPKPLFTAISPSTGSPSQPITVKPTISSGPSGTYTPGVMVLFGTGSYLATDDDTNKDRQTFYGILDKGITSTITRAQLVQKTFNSTTTTTSARTLNNSSVDYATKYGWYLDLPDPVSNTTDPTERVVSKALLLGKTLFFPTIVPTTNSCGGGGSSWLMAVNPIDGNAPTNPTFDTNNNGIISAADNLGTGGNDVVVGLHNSKLIPDLAYIAGDNSALTTGPNSGQRPCAQGSYIKAIGTASDTTVSTQGVCAENNAGTAGRLSWRRLNF